MGPRIIPDPKDRMQREPLLIAVILTVATGCDNVAWGGLELHLQTPSSPTELSSEQPDISSNLIEEEQSLEVPNRPILLAGARTGSTATLVVVGEVDGNPLRELPDESITPGSAGHSNTNRVARGSEWVLFSEGVRIGRMIAQEVSLDERFCTRRPVISRIVELVPEASDAEQLMATPIDAAGSRLFEPYVVHRHNYDQRVSSLVLASEAIPSVGAEWPPSLLNSRADIHAFQFLGEPGEAIAATFVYQDQMIVSPPKSGAYSLFVLGDEVSGNYENAYTWYRPTESQGKGVPRYFDHIDWNGDGSEEVLLEVFGPENRWFAGLTRQGGDWIRSFEDSCSQPTVKK